MNRLLFFHKQAVPLKTKYTHLFFDLDGTLIDSKPGIFSSLHYTMDELGIPESGRPADLNAFIGPPLRVSFKTLFGFDNEMAELATITYREYYTTQGWSQFRVFSEIPETLQWLRDRGFKLSVVTSKAELYTAPVLEKAGISSLFQTVSGCEINGDRSEKAELIAYTLEKLGLNPSPGILMIGDRNFDIIGARLAGISAAGVTYGYGSREELLSEKPVFLIDSPRQLISEIC